MGKKYHDKHSVNYFSIIVHNSADKIDLCYCVLVFRKFNATASDKVTSNNSGVYR